MGLKPASRLVGRKVAKDAYQTLGLTPDADKESIKLAYYAFRRQFAALKKPTRAQTERLVRINTAWDILKIPERKANYDTELARLAKAKRDRDEATRRKQAQESATPPPAPPPTPGPEPEPDPDPVEEEDPVYDHAWQPPPPRHGRPKPVSPIVWKVGTGVGVLYILASLMKPTATVPPPVADTKVETPAKKVATKVARKKSKRRARPGSDNIRRRSHDSQDAAELNRRELERLRAATVYRSSETPPTSRPENEF